MVCHGIRSCGTGGARLPARRASHTPVARENKDVPELATETREEAPRAGPSRATTALRHAPATAAAAAYRLAFRASSVARSSRCTRAGVGQRRSAAHVGLSFVHSPMPTSAAASAAAVPEETTTTVAP